MSRPLSLGKLSTFFPVKSLKLSCNISRYYSHELRTYDFTESPFFLTAENRSHFQEKRLMPFLSTTSLNTLTNFQSRLLNKVNQLTHETALEKAALYRVIYATRNQLDKALLHTYASQAWNTDFFLSQLVF